eukprot:TRINITY_DN35521_c0_g1_i1.p1 TRINITY_DN35521_c0_g1~~TRINITY_DN35521_c0_g1_i1.p1  ORF type:complete len:249 (+),score=49.41 TRINITY_DN35521_c0_g1_i1:56-802(+)
MRAAVSWQTPMAGGQKLAPPAAGGLSECAQMIRIGQRKSRPFKTAWEAYCSVNGSTAHDPAKHDDHFITAFLDTLGSTILLSMPAGGPAAAAPRGMKRGPDPGWGSAPMSPLKQQMVEAVKRFQKENPDRKEAWHVFCDTELGGNRDPARHEPDVLQAFLEQQGVSVDSSAGGWQQQRKMPANHMQFDTSMTPLKQQFVERVKKFQKENPGKKELWHQYCDSELGGNRDPARHPVEVLQVFLDTYEAA